ncbi:MAG: AEC family transporter [Bacteroidales bacterium]
MALELVLRQIAVLAILVLAGIIASRAGVFTVATKDVLSRIIFYVTLPALLFTNFSKVDLTPELLAGSMQALLLSLFVLLFMLLMGAIVAKLFGLKGSHEAIFRLHSMLGNVIYLGLPLIATQFGREGLLYASLFVLVSNILMWTVGVALVTPGSKFSMKNNLLKLLNINTIAIISGFVLFLLSVKLPPIILDSVGALGSTTTYLSMIYIGAVLYFADARKMLGNRNVYLLSVNRLLVVPFMLIGIFVLMNYLFPGLLRKEVLNVIVMQAAMPCMVNVVIMVNILGKDDYTATANVFVSTILSVITLPLILLSLRLIA